MVDEGKVLTFVTSKTYRQMRTEELARHFSVKPDEMDAFVAMLTDLELRGSLVKVKKRQWVNPERVGLISGRLQCNPRGFGFLIPFQEDAEDVYISPEDMGEAMDGDLVVAEVRRKKPGRKGGRRNRGPAGRIIKVLEHRSRQVIGTFVPGRTFGRVVPDKPGLFRDIYIAKDDWRGAKKDQKVLVEVTAWPSLHRNPEGEVREVLGSEGEPGVDTQSVILEFNLPREFPPAAIQAAQKLRAEPTDADRKARRDLTRHVTLTIDPEDAKDFDDALSLYRDKRTGRRVVLVHIADVSAQIAPDSPLDVEARKRGCSVYLASDVVPMLPHEQSKNVLSLVEGQDRLAKTVTMEFDDAGNMVKHAICHSIVNVDRRMSYVEVQEVLEALDAEEPAAASAANRLPQDIVELLADLDELAGQLRRRRTEVGSVDLDVPDYHVSIGEDGRVVGVSQIVRDRSHGLVEEFMLSANRAVATFMNAKKLPALYRVHDEPLEEDLAGFAAFIQTILHRTINPLDRKQLQALLAEVAGSHLSEAVNMQLLRTMQRALYTTACKPHFALHFDRYLHFTSPVRRYPDTVVHQILDQHLLAKPSARSSTSSSCAIWRTIATSSSTPSSPACWRSASSRGSRTSASKAS